MSYKETLDYLYSLESPEIKLGLERIQALLDNLENPEKKLKCIHVAGTNGKGSVCAMLSSILVEAGYKVGMYTSPHLKDFRERFLINGVKISEEEFTKYFERVKPFVTEQTFFEV